MKKSVFFFFLCFSLPFWVNGQTPIDFCGTFTKPPVHTTSVNRTIDYYDRFGNDYEEQELLTSNLQGYLSGTCNSGYFNLIFHPDFTFDEQETICDVFKELSSLIPTNNTNKIDILIDFVDEPKQGYLAYGSPYFENKCGISNSIILSSILSTINIPSNIKSIYQGKIVFNIAKRKDWGTKKTYNSGLYHLATIARHEALHVLGFASGISASGNPALGTFYTRWDKLLYGEGKGPLISPSASNKSCCNSHKFNSLDFPNAPADYDECNDNIYLKLNIGGNNIAPVTNNDGKNYTLNNLSHFFIDCNGFSNEQYVTHPKIDKGDVRTITDSEIEALCGLGYPVKGCENKPNCSVLAVKDNYAWKIGSPPLVIKFADILKNDIVSATAQVTFVSASANLGTVIVNSSDFTVTPLQPGILRLFYQITDKNCSPSCDIGQIVINVNSATLSTSCPIYNCNYLCYGDFEAFQTGPNIGDNFYDPILGVGKETPVFYVNNKGNSVDILRNINDNDNQYLRAANCTFTVTCHKENPYFKVTQPIKKNQKAVISLKIEAVNYANSPTVSIYALSEKPCTNIPYPAPTNGSFQLCSGVTATNITNSVIPIVAKVANAYSSPFFPNNSKVQIEWINNSDFDISYFLIIINGSDDYDVYMDDVIIQSSTDDNIITAKAELLQPFEIGKTSQIKYKICSVAPINGSAKASDISLTANLFNLTGIYLLDNNDFKSGIATFKLNPGECKDIILDVQIDKNFVGTNISRIELDLDATNACNSNVSKIEETDVLILNPAFTYSYDNPCGGNNIKFTAVEKAYWVMHDWDFGDANAILGQIGPTATHIYTQPGTYTVKHTVKYLNAKYTYVLQVVVSNTLGTSNLNSKVSQLITNKTLNNTGISKNIQYVINGTIVFDVPYNFDGCTFSINAGAKIEITEGVKVTFDNCEFYTCNDQMWQGIEVLAPTKGNIGGEIVMKNCTRVEDAHNAIKLNDKTSATIIGNIFSKNYVNIYTENAILNNFIAYDNKHNSFKQLLKFPYTGQKIPAKWYDTYTAYWIKNSSNAVGGITIGNPNNLNPTSTEFIDGTKNGILAVNSSLKVHHVSFKNITANSFYSLGQPIQGDAINSTATNVGTSLYVNSVSIATNMPKFPTYIENTDRGVYAKNVATYVRAIGMKKVGSGVVLENCGIAVVVSNEIDGGNGINTYNCTPEISNNTINITNTNTTASAILINNSIGSSVKNNVISISNVGYGIRVVNSSKAVIAFNKPIKILSSRRGSSSWFTDGINIINSTECKIVDNKVEGVANSGNDPFETPETVGIFMQNSSTNDYCCNSVDYTYEGVEARGVNNISNKFKGTTLDRHRIGLYVRYSGSTIGLQAHMGNFWTNPNIPFPAINDNDPLINTKYYGSNQFIVYGKQGSNVFPNNITPPTDWFKSAFAGTTFKCSEEPTCKLDPIVNNTPNSLDAIDMQLLKEADISKIYGEVNTWKLTRNLYEKISANPSLKSADNAVINFYEQYQNSNIATFTGIKEGLDHLHAYGAVQLLPTEKNIDGINTQIDAIDIKLSSSTDKKNLEIEKANLLQTLSELNTKLQADGEAIKKEKQAELNILAEKNEQITTEHAYEENLKIVNAVTIALQLTESSILSKEHRGLLEKVAYQCDMQGGEAVQSARAMLSWYDAKYNFGRDNTCEEIFDTKQQKNNLSQEFKIYPNPSNDLLTLDIGNQKIDEVSIFTIDGQLIETIAINDQFTPINVSYLQNGIHYCLLKNSNRVVTRIKFTIIR